MTVLLLALFPILLAAAPQAAAQLRHATAALAERGQHEAALDALRLAAMAGLGNALVAPHSHSETHP